jgi:hypothetical protein
MLKAWFSRGFDPRQLHQRKLVKGQKPWPVFFFINVSSRIAWVRWSRRTYEQRDRAGADDDAALALKEVGPFPAG